MAIAGSFLIGLGFDPFQAATLCLVANTAPVAWGGVGNPIRVLAGVTGLPETALSAMTGRILPPLSAILPLWLVRSMVGWRETLAVWPALAVSGLSFALAQFYWSNYQESGLVDVVAALVSLLAMVGFLKVWRPATIVAHDGPGEAARNCDRPAIRSPPCSRGGPPSCSPRCSSSCAAQPAVAKYLSFAALKQPMPGLHQAVLRVPPVVHDSHAGRRDRRPEPAGPARHGGLRRRCARGALARHVARAGSSRSSAGRSCG